MDRPPRDFCWSSELATRSTPPPPHPSNIHRFGPESILAPARYVGGPIEPVPVWVMAQGPRFVNKWWWDRDRDLWSHEWFLISMGAALTEERGGEAPSWIPRRVVGNCLTALMDIRLQGRAHEWKGKPLPAEASFQRRFYKSYLEGEEDTESDSLTPTEPITAEEREHFDALLHCSETPPLYSSPLKKRAYRDKVPCEKLVARGGTGPDRFAPTPEKESYTPTPTPPPKEEV